MHTLLAELFVVCKANCPPSPLPPPGAGVGVSSAVGDKRMQEQLNSSNSDCTLHTDVSGVHV